MECPKPTDRDTCIKCLFCSTAEQLRVSALERMMGELLLAFSELEQKTEEKFANLVAWREEQTDTF